MEGVHVVAAGPGGLGDESQWVQGQSPVVGLRDEVPQKLKQNAKLAYNF